MTAETIGFQTYGVMAFVTESLSAGVTFSATVQSHVPNPPVTHDILSDFSE